MNIEISLSLYFNKIINSNERLVLSMGLSFIALVLFANLTKGQTSALDDRFLFPVYTENSEDCDIVIEFNTLSGKALYVTMTTNYNETHTDVLDKIPFVMPLKPYLGLNASKVLSLTGNGTFIPTIRRLHGDALQLFSTECLGVEYVVCVQQDQFITIFGADFSTTVTLKAMDNTTNNTYTLNFGETVSFKPVSSRVFLIESTGKIGVIYSDKNLTEMCASRDIVWEMIPPTYQADTNFIVYIPEARSAYLEVVGYQDGQLTLHTAENTTSMSLKAFKRTLINANQARHVHITSSTPVTVMCIVNLTTGSDSESTNMFNVGPVQQSSKCLYFKAFNCTEAPCGYVTSMNATGHIKLFDQDGKVVRVFNSSNQQTNGTFSSWEINDVSDGIYCMQSEEMPFPFVVFYIDLSHGRYCQTLMSNRTICDRISNTQSTNITAEENISITTLNSVTTVPNNVSVNVTDYTTGAYTYDGNMTSNATPSNSSSVTQSSQSVPKKGTLLYLSSNTTNDNDTTVVQQSVNNRILFPFMYEEIPDDDSVLNEYLIAVIVSLCTAICAVIGVISTFLLLEVLRRRRQLRNTKIRPFVS